MDPKNSHISIGFFKLLWRFIIFCFSNLKGIVNDRPDSQSVIYVENKIKNKNKLIYYNFIMKLNGNELQISRKKYLMQLLDGNLFYLGKLIEKNKKISLITENCDVESTIFIFENMPPANKAFNMRLWSDYRIFLDADDFEENYFV